MLTPKHASGKALAPDALEKSPVLDPSEDFYFLRRKGIEYIERMGSREWTDYNSHDPGITLLEALCYAISELGFRAGMDIQDILADPSTGRIDPKRQAFYSARDILTVSPLTIDDYRRLLIDLDAVRNAWIVQRQSQCEVWLYADCKRDSLGFAPPVAQDSEIRVAAQGTYDVLLELESLPGLGDLNEMKVTGNFPVKLNEKNYGLTVELRFPGWDAVTSGKATGFYSPKERKWLRKITSISVAEALFKSDQPAVLAKDEENRRWRQWFRVFYLIIDLKFEDGGHLKLTDVPLKFFGASELSQAFKTLWNFSDINPTFFVGLAEIYIKKSVAVEESLQVVRRHLNDHRNLCEDFCHLSLAGIEDVAVCADVVITPDADIERVLANVLFEIERYFNPGLKFYTLAELLAEGVAVDEIFDGPKLDHGFIKPEDLAAAQLKTQLRTSDIINRLVEIEGVVAVKNVLLTRYDAFGQAVPGVADGGVKDRISAAWTLEISPRYRPKLYVDNSRFIFIKNGLPFTAHPSEVQDTLNELRGRDERMKIKNPSGGELDLPVPEGVRRAPAHYYPVQYSLPLTYGTGAEGVRLPASDKRRAQAKQLKGYLMVFEQLLANAFAQISNTGNLFAVDKDQLQTYFFDNLRDDNLIRGVEEILKPSLDDSRLQQLSETEPERIDRRNRVLDHLLARFAESFADYAMLLRSINSKKKLTVDTALIGQKIAFLEQYPVISRERDRSFNYLRTEPDSDNQAVLRKRLSLVLGMQPEQENNILIIEHLLLRPKFPGDAVMDVCLDMACRGCAGSADPYSYQLTLIMPGWQQPFNSDTELRRFIDRTIQQEVPAHLLAKTCWVSNLQYGEGWDDRLIDPLADFLRDKGKNAGSNPPGMANAKQGAGKLLLSAKPVFREWITSKAVKQLSVEELKGRLITLFETDLPALPSIYGGVKNYDELGETIYRMLAEHFADVALSDLWFQFDRFNSAWQVWLTANAAFEWQYEQVLPKIETAMTTMGVSKKGSPAGQRRARKTMERFAAIFSSEMQTNARNGIEFETELDKRDETFRIFELALTDAVLDELGIALKHKAALKQLFAEIYFRYTDVTLKLWHVVARLGQLTSIYPPATLHDCDDSNDSNPVRLGSTMLGGQ